ncbi:hypothetical protein [Gordonia malaquae]|uniref:hypothetical protein n=1 Tax=Gordonia malaquae TaxID=410332 RepID=UPI0030176D3C
MKKWFAAIAAVVAVAGVAGCGSDSKDSTTPSSATSAATSTEWTGSNLPPVDLDAVNTWPEFGKAGLRLMADCDPSTKVWGCIWGVYDQMNEIYSRMPHDAAHAPGAFDRWLNNYQEWEDAQCFNEAAAQDNFVFCKQKEMQMDSTDDRFRARFREMADGGS